MMSLRCIYPQTFCFLVCIIALHFQHLRYWSWNYWYWDRLLCMRITKSKLSNCHIVLSIFEYLSKLLFRSASLTSFIRSEKCYRDELVNHTPVHARPLTFQCTEAWLVTSCVIGGLIFTLVTQWPTVIIIIAPYISASKLTFPVWLNEVNNEVTQRLYNIMQTEVRVMVTLWSHRVWQGLVHEAVSAAHTQSSVQTVPMYAQYNVPIVKPTKLWFESYSESLHRGQWWGEIQGEDHCLKALDGQWLPQYLSSTIHQSVYNSIAMA